MLPLFRAVVKIKVLPFVHLISWMIKSKWHRPRIDSTIKMPTVIDILKASLPRIHGNPLLRPSYFNQTE